MNDNKNSVFKTYEKIANWFDEHRSRELFEKTWLDKAISLIPPTAHILDLGCGMGEPIIPYFLEKNFSITALDGSSKLIDIAKSRYPEVEFILGDMRKLKINQKFDMLLAWHSLFHLTQEDQKAIFPLLASHLKPRGILLFTSGEEEGEIWSNNGGEILYHASLSPDEYKNILKQCGFSLIEYKISDPACGNATIWLAKLES